MSPNWRNCLQFYRPRRRLRDRRPVPIRLAAVHVHCIYNARVSAFMLKRARIGRGGDPIAAAHVMKGIWQPGLAWAAFMGDEARKTLPRTYKGYDY